METAAKPTLEEWRQRALDAEKTLAQATIADGQRISNGDKRAIRYMERMQTLERERLKYEHDLAERDRLYNEGIARLMEDISFWRQEAVKWAKMFATQRQLAEENQTAWMKWKKEMLGFFNLGAIFLILSLIINFMLLMGWARPWF